MRIAGRAGALALGLAVVALASACVAWENGDDASELAEGAGALAGGGSQPIRAGAYDMDDGSLSVIETQHGQEAYLLFGAGSATGSCFGPTRVEGGKVKLVARGCDVALEPGADSMEVSVTGTMSSLGRALPLAAKLKRRGKDALVGKYGDGTTTFSILSSADGKLTYSVRSKGALLAEDVVASSHPTSVVGWASSFKSKLPSCDVELLLIRGGGGYAFYVDARNVTDSASCPPRGIMSKR
jgi:hypothetical protein